MDNNFFDHDIIEVIGKKLIEEKETIAVAESVTSGLLQFAFSNIPDAEKFYHGGITAYNIGQKYKHLNVETIHAIAVNCVSQKIADEMAAHVTRMFNSHWGIGVTGYASPTESSGNKTFAYYAITHKQSIVASGKLDSTQPNPPAVQKDYAEQILQSLRNALQQ